MKPAKKRLPRYRLRRLSRAALRREIDAALADGRELLRQLAAHGWAR